MISLLVKHIQGDGIQRLMSNFLSLTVLNVINYLFPVILVPFLTRKLGVESYGKYVFVLVVFSYLTMLVRFGYEYSATKLVSINRDNKPYLKQLFSSVLVVRILLFCASCFLLFLFIAIIPQFRDLRVLFLCALGVLFANGIMPIWFFQGMEKMKFMAISNFASRFCGVVLIIFLVKTSDDIWKALVLQSIASLIGLVICFFLIVKQFKISLVKVQRNDVIERVKDGWHMFLTSLGMNFYRESNVLILGFLTNYEIVGCYAAAEKLIKAIQSLFSPFVQALFPFFGKRFGTKSNQEKDLRAYRKFGRFFALLLLVVSLLIAFLSPWIVEVYLGEHYASSILNIQIMSGVIFFGGLNYFYGIVGMVNMGQEKKFTQQVWIVGLFSVVLSGVFSFLWKDIGASIVLVAAELLLFILIIRKIKHVYTY